VKAFVTQADFTCRNIGLKPFERPNVTISAPVGDGGRCKNRSDDVKTIQIALNSFSALDGGSSPSLVPDGICGRLTKAAILHFQKKWEADLSPFSPDGVVDIDGPTIKRFRKGAGTPATSAQQFAAHLARVTEIITTARAAITLARASQQLTGMSSSLPSISDFSIAALARIERHFHVSKTSNPSLAITRVEQVYLDMQRAIGHIPQGVVLLVDEPPSFAVGAFMFTAGGGYRHHLPGDVFNGTNLPIDSIYLCPRSRTLIGDNFVYAIIHELGHYVGPDSSEDFAYFHKDPQKYRNLTPEFAFRNADCYSQFAFDAVGKRDFKIEQGG
jgi:hypothetical protein